MRSGDLHRPVRRVAFICVHGCPVARLGERETGGMNVYLLQTALGLGTRGIAVDVFTRAHDPNDPQIVHLGPLTRVIHLEAGSFEEEKEALYWRLPQFARNLHTFVVEHDLNYQVIHSHYWLSGKVGMFLARQWRVPHVTTMHTLAEIKQRAYTGGQEPEMRADWEGRVMRAADLTLTFSEHERDAVMRYYQVPRGQACVLPAGVDTGMFKPLDRNASKRALGLEGRRVVLYVGRIEPIKGVDILVRAASLLSDYQDLQVLIVGGGKEDDPESQGLKALTQELGLQNVVKFLGSIKQAELPNYYNAADVLVLPSYYESFGLVALEAMACGVPVVASRVGGLPTFVKDGETGYLVPWRCPDAFAQRLEVLLGNDSLRDCMGKAGRERALALSWDRVVARLEDTYDALATTPLAAVCGDD